MNALALRLISPYQSISDLLNLLQPVALLLSRLYVSWVFFASGMTKIRDWDTTLFLFEEEYAAPLLNSEVAAYLATFGELVFPALLAIGLASRFNAIGLSIINIVAVMSLVDIPPAAFYLHVIWGILLANIVFFSGGKISFDYLLGKKLKEK